MAAKPAAALALLILPLTGVSAEDVPFRFDILIIHGQFEDFVWAPPELCTSVEQYLDWGFSVEVSCVPPLSEFSLPWECGQVSVRAASRGGNGTRVYGGAGCDDGPLAEAIMDGEGTTAAHQPSMGHAFPFHCRAEFLHDQSGNQPYGSVRCLASWSAA